MEIIHIIPTDLKIKISNFVITQDQLEHTNQRIQKSVENHTPKNKEGVIFYERLCGRLD